MTARTILYLDGLGYNPTGVRQTFLRGLGYTVVCPELSERDFDAAVAAGREHLHAVRPDVVVGYSRGGAVAVLVGAGHDVPAILVAPAVRRLPDGTRLGPRTTVLHSAGDDSIPLDAVRAVVAASELPADALRIVGSDHTMIDADVLAALRELVEAFPCPARSDRS